MSAFEITVAREEGAGGAWRVLDDVGRCVGRHASRAAAVREARRWAVRFPGHSGSVVVATSGAWCGACRRWHAVEPVGADLDRHRIAMWNKPLEVVRG